MEGGGGGTAHAGWWGAAGGRVRGAPRLLQKQGGGDAALFLYQDIERSAGGAEVHRFDSDATGGEGGADFGRGETLARACAEQNPTPGAAR